jgi:endoglucanase
MHTPVEMCDLRDVENAINLIVESVKSFKETDSFIPGT